MRATSVSAIALAALLSTPVMAQQGKQPNATADQAANQASSGQPQTEQAQNYQQRLQQIADNLRKASESGDKQATDKAKQEANQALRDTREMLSQLNPEQRAEAEQQIAKAEQALQGQDTQAGIDAVLQVRRVVGLVAVPVPVQGQQAQSGAQILVEQAAPKLTVLQPEPEVTVRQPQPVIIVRQPEPTVTIDIPQPEIIVRMPKPEVNVSQAQPQVRVQQAKPEVEVRQNEPQVQVQQAEQTQVRVQQLADTGSNVRFEGNREPQIRYEQAEPRVVVNQAEGQPQIRVEEMDAAAMQEEERRMSAVAPTTREQLANPAVGTSPNANSGTRNPLDGMRGQELMDKTVYGAAGEVIGDVENVVISRQNQVGALVVGVGGFLGIGEREVAIPLDRLKLGPNGRLIAELTKDQIGSMRPYEEAGYDIVDPNENIGTTLSR